MAFQPPCAGAGASDGDDAADGGSEANNASRTDSSTTNSATDGGGGIGGASIVFKLGVFLRQSLEGKVELSWDEGLEGGVHISQFSALLHTKTN